MKYLVDFAIAAFLVGFLVVLLHGCAVDEVDGANSSSAPATASAGFDQLVVADHDASTDAMTVVPCGITCDDGNACTTDTCDTTSGKCVNTSKGWDCWPCATDEDCTLGMVTCQGDGLIHEDGYGVCLSDKTCETFHKTKSCDDNNPCTIDACSTEDDFVFCENLQVSCNDGVTCTIDTCDSVSGKCQHDGNKCEPAGRAGPPVSCKTDVDCSDGNPCTSDPCWEGECWGHPFSCDDNDPCTNDTCSPKQVCDHQAIPGCKP